MKATFCLLRKTMSVVVLIAFLVNMITPAGAQVLPAPGSMLGLTAGFKPPLIIGLKIHPENPLLFDFIVDQGEANLNENEFKKESEELVKYFLAALTIPDKEVWVNLSPYEKDRIIPDMLGTTLMGQAMLEEDYILKQLASSLTNPEEKMGQEFWAKVKASSGNSEAAASTFNKVWIVPQKAEVLESDGIVLIGDKRLQVKMADEYENMNKEHPAQISKASSQIFKEQILPKIEKEVNEGKNFAKVRQIYNSVILATWYKKALKESLLGQVYADKGKVIGVENGDKDVKQKVYEQYLAAFKKGAYNLIKEETDTATGEMIPRKYFSGGAQFGDTVKILRDRTVPMAVISNTLNGAASSSPIKSVTARLAEPGVEQGVVVQKAASPAKDRSDETTGLFDRDKLAGTFIVESLLSTLRELRMGVANFQVFFGEDMATKFNLGISDEDVFQIIDNKFRTQRDNPFATIDGTQNGLLEALYSWTQALIKTETQFEGQTPNWMPWVLGAIMQDLESPSGLVGYNLKNGTTLIVPLNGGVSAYTEVLIGNEKLFVEFSEKSQGIKLQMASTGQADTFTEGNVIAVGRNPMQPDLAKPGKGWVTFEMKKVSGNVGVSRSHVMVKGWKDSSGARFLAFKDGSPEGAPSSAGTFVLTRGVPKESTKLLPGKSSSALTEAQDKIYREIDGYIKQGADSARVLTSKFLILVRQSVDNKILLQALDESERKNLVVQKWMGRDGTISLDVKIAAEEYLRRNPKAVASSATNESLAIAAELTAAIVSLGPGAVEQFDLFQMQYIGSDQYIGLENNDAISAAIGTQTPVRRAIKNTFDRLSAGSRSESARFDLIYILGMAYAYMPSKSSSAIEDPFEDTQTQIAEINQVLSQLESSAPQNVRDYIDAYRDRLAYLIAANNIFGNIEIKKLRDTVQAFASFSQSQWSAKGDFLLWLQRNRVEYPGEFMYLAVPESTWKAQREQDYLTPPNYAKDGFVRFASYPDTAVAQANRLGVDVNDNIVILKINKVRATEGGPININLGQENTPRLYNVMARRAVEDVIALTRNNDGILEMPADILKRERSAASSAAGDEVMGRMQMELTAKGLRAIAGSQNIQSGDFTGDRNYVAHLYGNPATNEKFTVVEVFVNEETLVEFKIIPKDLLNPRISDVEMEAAYNQATDLAAASAALVTENNSPVGGIDFDPTNMNLQIKRDGRGVPLPLPDQNLQQINIEGLVPVIINVVPINTQNLPIFLGQAPKEPGREPSGEGRPELAASLES